MTSADQRTSIPDALQHLAAIGDPDDIATYLAGRGHTGQSITDSCPVALYIRAETGLPVAVDPYLGSGLASLDDYGDDYPLPDPVCSFARSFDAGRYPGLLVVETASEAVS